MTNPTQDHSASARWWLELDDGELLAVDEVPETAWRTIETGPSVLLRLPAARAYDLSKVLSLYTRFMRLFDEATHVSGYEHQLSSALRDASLAAREQTQAPTGGSEPSKVTSKARLRAMAVLQQHRPTLSHTALIGVVDAAARWVDEQEDDLASGLLEAAGGEEAGGHAWLILLDLDQPPAPKPAGGTA